MSKGVQACRPAYMHACMCKHMQVHTAWYAKAVISARLTRIDHDDQKVFMYACIAACVLAWTVALHINKGVQACKGARTQVCTCEHMQTRTADVEAVITARDLIVIWLTIKNKQWL